MLDVSVAIAGVDADAGGDADAMDDEAPLVAIWRRNLRQQ